MKKILGIIILLIITITLISCSKKVTFSIEQNTYDLEVNQQIALNIIVTNCDSPIFNYEFNQNGIIEIDNQTITAISEGTVVVRISLVDNKKVDPIEITVNVVQPPYIQIEGAKENLNCGETLKLTLNKVKVEGTVEWNSSNKEVATITRSGLVVVIGEGTTIITATCGSYTDQFTLTITKPLTTEIIVDEISKMEVNSSLILNYDTTPLLANKECLITSSDTNIIEINDNKLIAKALGTATITVSTTDASNLIKSFEVTVIENLKPVITCDTSKITVNWNDMEAVYEGINAIDNCDGDISNQIQVDTSFDCKEYGVHTVKYKVVDKAGNEATYTRQVEVVWNYSVKFIGHMGSYFGGSNSEEAIRYALEKLHYQAVEIDLKQTSDGVFVLSHDSVITVSDGTKVDIGNTTWEELQKYEITETRNSGYPEQYGLIENGTYTYKICTLETYLNLCKEYNAMAVIELKTSSGISNYSQDRMQALMDKIESQDMLHNVIFLTSQYKCLEWVKTNGYEYIECQYLVGSCESNDVLNECIKYGFTVSINVTDYSNSEEWLAKYKNAGLKISTYTFSQWNPYSQVQKWIDLGVDYVTCDWHLMEELELPAIVEENN